jgi:hypothetical protein
MTGDLTTTAAVNLWLGANTTDPSIPGLISAASAFFTTQADRFILNDWYTETYDGPGHDSIILLQSPVTGIQFVTLDGLAIQYTANSWENGFMLDLDGVITLTSGVFRRGRRNVQVSYSAGYTTVPLDVQQAVTEIVAYWIRGKDRIGQKNKSIGGEVIGYSTADIPPAADSTMRRYARKF